MDDEEPLWKRVLLNEVLWVLLAAFAILGIAFHFATKGKVETQPPEQRSR